MNREKQDLIDDLARKMAVNDLMYDYRIRAITEFAEKLENLFAIPVVRHIVCPECGCNKLQHEGNNQYLCLSVICDFQGQIMP